MAENSYSFYVHAHSNGTDTLGLLSGARTAQGQTSEHAKAKLIKQLAEEGWIVDDIGWPTFRIDPLTYEDAARIVRAEIDRLAENMRNSMYVHIT